MIFIIKLMLLFFILGLSMLGITGFAFCIHLAQKLNSTIRIIIYTGFTIIFLVTLGMDLSFNGIPILALYGMGFILIGFCSIPIRYLWRTTDENQR